MECKRQFPLLSACGLNCGLCPRYHTDGDSKCPGCGGENFSKKHPPCGVLSCSQRHNVEYCYLHDEYPCKKYSKWKIDSFITHQNMMKDFEKAKNTGIEAYQKELNEKMDILNVLLQNYNDGRRKNFFCIAVNLLDIKDIKSVLKQIEKETKSKDISKKEKSAIAVNLFNIMAEKRNVKLELIKK
jgi:hypothetical protein